MKNNKPEKASNPTQPVDLIAVGDLIRTHRERIGMTQFELSEKAKVGEKTITRLELGKSSMRIDTFFTLAAALSVTPNDISPACYTSFDKDSRFIDFQNRYNLLCEREKQFIYDVTISLMEGLQKLG